MKRTSGSDGLYRKIYSVGAEEARKRLHNRVDTKGGFKVTSYGQGKQFIAIGARRRCAYIHFSRC
jgi:hypothetical protein